MRHQPSRVLYQIAQDRKRLWRQQDSLIVSLVTAPPQTLVNGVKPEWGKSFMDRAEVVFYFELPGPSRTE
jgi:hypothetical protein